MNVFIQHRSMKRARDIRDQLVGLMRRVRSSSQPTQVTPVVIRKAITTGYFYHVAHFSKCGGMYETVQKSQTVTIHPQSCPQQKTYHPG
ncbi:hypothetical protein Pcinc_036512 [Petrolisthes cinctipes]|uniref:Uncharacterized protein n=1 Tax=Petrolisthes cinctipes TaxID=88211 RepID=A0AAE1BXQ3_PETCI|nr:hypothetical protein Pcinc_036512 [Petrolisthes cinctipes]